MCRIYNEIGSLTAVKSHLYKNDIGDFKSLKEVIDFQASYSMLRQQLISHHENLIEQEKNMLIMDLQQLESEIQLQRQQAEQRLTNEIDELRQQLNTLTNNGPTTIFQRLTKDLRQWYRKCKIRQKEENFHFEVKKSINSLVDTHEVKSNRYQFITSQFDEVVRQISKHPLSELERKKGTIDELSSFIYGALGEQKVVKTLEVLSDEYILINDFAVSFSPAIYNRQENDYIKSVQIDHILVSPSGVFIIETKNWSEESLENLSLRSPVQQIKRTSDALYRLLNNKISNRSLNLDQHLWGERKISIRNLIVFTGTKPTEEFQHVKILTLNELLSYVNYFKPIFSAIEMQGIADYLIDVNIAKVIPTKRK